MDQVVAQPFPHVIRDDGWDPALLRNVIEEFPDPSDGCWQTFNNTQERKQACENRAVFGPATLALVDMLTSDETCAEIGELFDIPNVTASIHGGGYHQILAGGLLGVHVDFNRGQGGLYRRVNSLLFLNDGWEPSWNGELVLRGEDGTCVFVAPLFNRTVLFATSDHSWHGHPEPWAGPRPRRSVAVYYYSTEPADPSSADHSTIFRG